MSIIAVLMLLTGTAFITVRDHYMVDSAAEEVLSMVRDAQNRAISIQQNTNGYPGKVWGTCFATSTGKATIISYQGSAQPLTTVVEPNSFTPTGVSLAAVYTPLSANPDDYCVAFSAPFAKTYLAQGGNFTWTESNNPTEDWESLPNKFLGNEDLVIELARNGYISRVYVNSKGDARIE